MHEVLIKCTPLQVRAGAVAPCAHTARRLTRAAGCRRAACALLCAAGGAAATLRGVVSAGGIGAAGDAAGTHVPLRDARGVSPRCCALRVAVRCVSPRARLLWRCVCASGWQAALRSRRFDSAYQALRTNLLTVRDVFGGVGVKAPRAPTLAVRHPLAACACVPCARPNLS